jgi:hypothetical protein
MTQVLTPPASFTGTCIMGAGASAANLHGGLYGTNPALLHLSFTNLTLNVGTPSG